MDIKKDIEKELIRVEKRIIEIESMRIDIDDYEFDKLKEYQGLLSRAQRDKGELLKLKHNVNQDVDVRNEEIKVRVEKLRCEIEKLAGDDNVDKVQLVVDAMNRLSDKIIGG